MLEERRRHARAARATSATLSRNCVRFGSFRAIDLSAGGALFRGASPVGVGQRLDLALPLSTGAFVDTAAIVLRQGRLHDRDTFAVGFPDLAPEARAAIDAAVRAAREELRRAQVLVVDYGERTGRRLAERLRSLDVACYLVATALEALHTLDAAHGFEAALVGLTLGAEDGREVLAALEARHPRVRRVLMSPSMSHAELAAASAGPTAGAPHALLAGSPSDGELLCALGRVEPARSARG
jgi:ActR/RegA family two-component response regulator